MSDHTLLDLRSLALHEQIAAKLRQDPRLIGHARSNLIRWRQQSGDEPWMVEWMGILDLSIDEVAEFLRDTGERATRLRQSSPFPGILTVQEREEIFARFKTGPLEGA